MARKTVDVEFVKNKTNVLLALPDSVFSKDQRHGVSALLEAVLFETDNYKGFSFQPSQLEEDGSLKPGADESRRRYL